ncbi:MAG: 2-phosphosulfolactate phosphatase [Verrucomicrobia bacterium]|nr:2-phosphosulfolactate phosphatase [Verrucomicrobiota bacterium]
MNSLEVSLTPAEFAEIKSRDLGNTTCVVFDILRATTSMTNALANGAEAIIPVSEISEAIAVYEKDNDVLLAGERHGHRILKDQTGSVDFVFGNSPREFTADKVAGKTIVTTTTNGTRALQACSGAKQVLIGSFLNLSAVANWIAQNKPENLLLVCAGTFEEAAYEDILAAGALADLVWAHYCAGKITDSTHIARQIYQLSKRDLTGAMQFARNGRTLMNVPDLRDDVAFCLRQNIFDFVAEMKGGRIRQITK